MSAANQDLTIEAARRALERGDASRAANLCADLVAQRPKLAAAWHVLGLARQKEGRRTQAVEALSRAASLERASARYHHDLANALVEDGKLDRGISSYRRALRIDESSAEVHNDLGTVYFQKAMYADAERCFCKAIELAPEHGVAHANLGAALRSQGRLQEGRRAFQRALVLKVKSWLPAFLRRTAPQAPKTAAPVAARNEIGEVLNGILRAIGERRLGEAESLAVQAAVRFPADADVLHVTGVILEEKLQLPEAIDRVRTALQRKPDRAEYHCTHARLLVKTGDLDAALEAAAQAMRLEPGSADVHATLSGIYHPWREDLAEQAARRAIDIDPESHVGHGNLAAALWGQSRLDEAERHGREALRRLPKQLSYRMNLALILKDRGKLEEARSLYRAMEAEAPEHPKVCLDMGTLVVECEGDLEAARVWYRRAQASGDPRGTLSEAIVDLLDGRFDSAWQNYVARTRLPDQRDQHALVAGVKQWGGEAQQNKGLLVYGEQGLGDEIMFASMLPDLARRVSKLTLVCDDRLGSLFERSFPAFRVIAEPRASQAARVARLDGIDYAVAAGSLGLHFRRHAGDFPLHAGYLVADPQKVAEWRARLGGLGPGQAIGLSWIGGLQKTGRSRRSLSLEELRPLLSAPDTKWISLQYTDCSAEIAAFASATGIRLHEFPDVTKNMDDLASLMAALDRVVSVCNTTVHVAGAIGKEVLVMAPFVPEWRYSLSGERMVWYPSARVFRQAAYGDWNGVLERVAQALTSKTRC